MDASLYFTGGMGHANVETTLDIYTEINYSKKQESLEELSKKIDFF